MVRQSTFNRYFHCCYRCCYMYIHVLDVNKDRIFFLFGVLRPAKHKRRWDHNLQEAHFLKCFDRCSDYIITSRKTRVECANSAKTMTFYERSERFRKYPKTPVFDNSNYRLFERIHAVPGTSNNRGLTVLLLLLFITRHEYYLKITFLEYKSQVLPSFTQRYNGRHLLNL